MEKLTCLGCDGAADFGFYLSLHRLRGGEKKSRMLGVCDRCSTPGTDAYQKFRQSFGSLLWMLKNELTGAGAKADSKTAAAGGDK